MQYHNAKEKRIASPSTVNTFVQFTNARRKSNDMWLCCECVCVCVADCIRAYCLWTTFASIFASIWRFGNLKFELYDSHDAKIRNGRNEFCNMAKSINRIAWKIIIIIIIVVRTICVCVCLCVLSALTVSLLRVHYSIQFIIIYYDEWVNYPNWIYD